jgi:hypothetical protein
MRPVRFSLLGLLLALLLLVPFEMAMADKPDKPHRAAGTLTVPHAGTVVDAGQLVGRFSGTMTINRFERQNQQIVAVGIARGTISTAAGQVMKSGLQTLVLPVTNIGSLDTVRFLAPSAEPRLVPVSLTQDMSGRFIPAQAMSCGILHLDIGGTAVNLLGLMVNLSPITLDISGDSAGPLGALVCEVLALLGTAADVVALLNQLLGVLTGLVGGLLGGLGG